MTFLRSNVGTIKSRSRALLAEELVESLEFDIDPTLQAAGMTEAKTCCDEVRHGAIQPIPGTATLAQVRRLLEP